MSSVPQFGSQFSGGLSTCPEPHTAGLTPAPQVPPMSQVPVAVCRVSSAVLGLPEELRKPVLCLNRSSLHCHCPLSLQLGLGWEGSLSSGQIRRPSCHLVPCLPATPPLGLPLWPDPPSGRASVSFAGGFLAAGLLSDTAFTAPLPLPWLRPLGLNLEGPFSSSASGASVSARPCLQAARSDSLFIIIILRVLPSAPLLTPPCPPRGPLGVDLSEDGVFSFLGPHPCLLW